MRAAVVAGVRRRAEIRAPGPVGRGKPGGPTAPAADARVEIGSGRRVASNASAPVARQIGPVIDFVSVRYQRPVNDGR
jgi:hypothetical protein